MESKSYQERKQLRQTIVQNKFGSSDLMPSGWRMLLFSLNQADRHNSDPIQVKRRHEDDQSRQKVMVITPKAKQRIKDQS